MAAPVVSGLDSLAELSRMRLAAKQQDPEALRAAARQFESMFTQMLLKSARDAKFGDDMLGSEQTDFYQDMFDQQMAQQMSAGKGLGIADLLIRQLQHGSAAPASAPATGITNTAPTAERSADFMSSILPHAQKAAAELGVPARAIAAQAALETGWGRHVMKNADGSSSFNLFGIKADASWKGARTTQDTTEYSGGVKLSESAQFRSYASLDEAFADYARFLKSNPRYAQALTQRDSAGFASGLQQAGYATDPAYARKIMHIAEGERMQLALANSGTSVA